MALLAASPQVVLVNIGVAAVTVGKLQAGKNLKFPSVPDLFLVAFDALYFPVFAPEGKISSTVVEFAGRRKGVGDVAAATIVRQGILMVILMAGGAILAQAQKGPFSFLQLRLIDEIGKVALPAIYPAVRPRQLIPRQAVVKIILIEAHHIEVPPVVFAMAFGTVLAPYLTGSVVPLTAADQALDLLMAVQALVIGDLLPQGMALGAVSYSFQLGMRARQGAGRKLGPQFRKV